MTSYHFFSLPPIPEDRKNKKQDLGQNSGLLAPQATTITIRPRLPGLSNRRCKKQSRSVRWWRLVTFLTWHFEEGSLGGIPDHLSVFYGNPNFSRNFEVAKIEVTVYADVFKSRNNKSRAELKFPSPQSKHFSRSILPQIQINQSHFQTFYQGSFRNCSTAGGIGWREIALERYGLTFNSASSFSEGFINFSFPNTDWVSFRALINLHQWQKTCQW